MNRYFLFLFSAIIIFVSSTTTFSQASQKRNILGILVDGVTVGPAIGIRGWFSNIGYSASIGSNWSLDELNTSGRLMVAFQKSGNKFFFIGRVGYLGFSDEVYNMSYNGSLVMVGLGLGYEWFLTASNAISFDAGYNLIGTTEYSIKYFMMGQYFQIDQKFEIPFWVGGSYTYYFN